MLIKTIFTLISFYNTFFFKKKKKKNLNRLTHMPFVKSLKASTLSPFVLYPFKQKLLNKFPNLVKIERSNKGQARN
jgi:hypothetical protein